MLVRGGFNGRPSNPGPAAAVSATSTPRAAATPTIAPTTTPSPSGRIRLDQRLPTKPNADPDSVGHPTPVGDRSRLLPACPNNLWSTAWYTVRRGDNLSAIAHYFGITLDAVRQLNPWTQTKGISPGDKLILPPPTR